MPSRAALFAPPQQQPQPLPRASEEKVDAVVAPVEASRDDGAAAPGATQQVTEGMRELRIAETEGAGKAMEVVADEEGPEPIIECNHKQPGAAPLRPSSSSKLSGEQLVPSSSQQQQQQESGGFFGMVQKTLGLGKHRASSTGGATQQQPLPAPAAVSPPLSPLRPENTYRMSDR